MFVEGKTDGVVEPTKTSSLTSLQTTDGKVSGIRIIADGDCGGGFSANELLLANEKPVTGCIGFEIPKNATPESITIVLHVRRRHPAGDLEAAEGQVDAGRAAARPAARASGAASPSRMSADSVLTMSAAG